MVDKNKKMKLDVNEKGHYVLYLIDADTKVLKVIETMFTDCNNQELYKKLEKMHLHTAHKSEDNIIRFLKESKNYNPNVRNTVS